MILGFTITPSNEFELFVDKLYKPEHLWVLSKSYSNNQGTLSHFFIGLERHRKTVIWCAMGLPITFSIYQKVIGTLVSLLFMATAFVLRGGATFV